MTALIEIIFLFSAQTLIFLVPVTLFGILTWALIGFLDVKNNKRPLLAAIAGGCITLLYHASHSINEVETLFLLVATTIAYFILLQLHGILVNKNR